MKNNEQVLARLKEDILFRGLSQSTLKSYTTTIQVFLKFCNRPVDQLDEHDIRNFLRYLIQQKRVKASTVNTYSAAIRFFFAVTLNRTLNYLQVPRQKTKKSYPVVLSREEVHAILENCSNLKHKAMLTLIYSSGLRVSEAAAIKVQHVEGRKKRVFVASGKGGKDRYTLLSDVCLAVLREYYLAYRPQHPEGWLFPGTYNVTHITRSGIADAFRRATSRANIKKDVSVHSLRHAFATHILEDGASLLQIKNWLGHSSISSTTIYLNLANIASDVKSPLDSSPAYSQARG